MHSLLFMKTTRRGLVTAGKDNIILNPSFEDGLKNWSAKGCNIELHESMGDGKVLPQIGKFFASATNRTENWNGIEQEITGRLQRKVAYEVTAIVRIYGNNVTSAGVQVTLWVQEPDFREEYIAIAKLASFHFFLPSKNGNGIWNFEQVGIFLVFITIFYLYICQAPFLSQWCYQI